MKTFTRGLCAALVTLSMIGMTGCADNEAEADKLGKAMGDPGAANPNSASGATRPAPKTQAEFKEAQDAAAAKLYGKGGDYTGTKAKK